MGTVRLIKSDGDIIEYRNVNNFSGVNATRGPMRGPMLVWGGAEEHAVDEVCCPWNRGGNFDRIEIDTEDEGAGVQTSLLSEGSNSLRDDD